MPLELFTIGHSTHSSEEFLALLTRHGIELLVDIRRFPGSRKFPHFNRDQLAAALAEAGIGYHWLESLGGRRRKSSDAPSRNLGWRNASFRNYADYMATDEFRAGLAELLEEAKQRRTAIMCSESVWWRCHRRLVSDSLLVQGIAVQHIMPAGDLRPHALTSGAQVEEGVLIYPKLANDDNDDEESTR